MSAKATKKAAGLPAIRTCNKAGTEDCPDSTCRMAVPHPCQCVDGTCLGRDGNLFKVRCIERGAV